MKNVRISVDDDLLRTVDEFAAASQLSRSAVVRQALRAWIRERDAGAFEEEWIQKLREEPTTVTEADGWMAAERWSR